MAMENTMGHTNIKDVGVPTDHNENLNIDKH